MANVRHGGGVVEMRGSIAGTTFSRNGFGAYTRARVKPINPATVFQMSVRSNLSAISKRWGTTLTEGQRMAWNEAGKLFGTLNKLGENVLMSGIALYQRLNLAMLNAGETYVDDPPVTLDVPAASSVVLTATAGTPDVLTFNVLPVPPGAPIVLYLTATPQFTPGRSFVKNDYRFIGISTDVTNPVDIVALWKTRFDDADFAAGMKIGVGVAYLNTDSGALSPAVTQSVIIG